MEDGVVPLNRLNYSFDQYASRISLDVTIKRKGGIHAFGSIEDFAIAQDTSNVYTAKESWLQIHDIYKPSSYLNPLQLKVTIGQIVVSLEFLLQDPVGRAAIEDHFALGKTDLGRTEMKDILGRWGLEAQQQDDSVVWTSADGSTIFWGPKGHARGYGTIDLGRTKAGRELLSMVCWQREVKQRLSLSNTQGSPTSGTTQRIERAAFETSPHEAWLRLLDLVEPQSLVNTEHETELNIYDIYRPLYYRTPADLLVRFGP